ncbi:MAG: hypothetical protein ACM3N9_05050 [Syntrophothermus sp.]
MLKKTGLILLSIFLVLLSAELMIYFLCPVYDFPAAKPFSGSQIHNPYAGMDSLAWRKANFHYHDRAWGGLTSGRKNSPELFYENYVRKLKYDYPEISDYMKINTTFRDSSFYIPVYEHGIGIRKKHQMLIGAKNVLWWDYSLLQNIHQKQDILRKLQGTSEIIAIAHPDWENGYTPGDMKLLTGYHLLEILDHNWRSFFQWDAALSAGHPVYILADDDSHQVDDPYQLGRCMTFINSGSENADSVVKALKNGCAFGADVYMSDNEANFDVKSERVSKIPVVKKVEVRGDTLFVRVSEIPIKITFIGQNQKVKKVIYNKSQGYYVLQPEDTYIRTEIKFYNRWKGPGTVFYLNPVFRYEGQLPDNDLKAEVNIPRTWIFRIFSIPALLVLLVIILQVRKKSRVNG